MPTDKQQDLLNSPVYMTRYQLEDRVRMLEEKLTAIQFYFEHMQIGDEQMMLTDENLNVLLTVLNKMTCK